MKLDIKSQEAMVTDQLGVLLAQVSDMNDVAGELKAILIHSAANSGIRAVDGNLYRSVVVFANKPVTNHEGVYAELVRNGVDQDMIDRAVFNHTQVAESVPAVRVYSR
jgi:hypothetical protein